MISSSVITALVFASIATTIIPVIIVIVLGIRKKITMLPFVVGMLAFTVSQMLLRVPLLNALTAQSWFMNFAAHTVLYVILIGGVSAGLFEESARYLGGKYLLKNKTTFKDCLSFGLGHGFIEVILFTGLTQISNTLMVTIINSGNVDLAVTGLTQADVDQIVAAFTSLMPSELYLAVLERVSAVLFHLVATTLVFQAINLKKIRYYFYAIAAHTLFNSVGVLAAQYLNIWIAEIVLLVLSAAGVYYMWRVKGAFPQSDTQLQIS